MLVRQGHTQAHSPPKLPWNCWSVVPNTLLSSVSCRITHLQSERSIRQGVSPTPDLRNLPGKSPPCPSQWQCQSTVFCLQIQEGFFLCDGISLWNPSWHRIHSRPASGTEGLQCHAQFQIVGFCFFFLDPTLVISLGSKHLIPLNYLGSLGPTKISD